MLPRECEGDRIHDAGHRCEPAVHGDDVGDRNARPGGEEDGVPLPLHVRKAEAGPRHHVHQHAST